MALTIDGSTSFPMMGGGYGTGSGVAAGGGGLLGGGLGALIGGALGAGLMGGRGGWGGNNWGGNGSPAAAAVATDVVLNPAFQSLQNQVEQLGSQISANEITTQIGQLGEQVANYNTNVLSAVGNVATAQAAANFTTLSSINALGRDITTIQNQAALQQLNSFNNLQFQNAQATNQIISQNATNAATNAANFCGISREMAECCCEIKGLIASDGASTRALINDLNVQNLRDALTAANNKVSNNEQNQYLLHTILEHLHPAVTVPTVVV